jgi:hypothetical protein
MASGRRSLGHGRFVRDDRAFQNRAVTDLIAFADDGFVMASAADYGSTFGIVVFVQELALLACCLARYGHGNEAGGDPHQADVECADKRLDDVEEHLDDDTRFLFDVVARQNEGVVQNIDALDNGFIAVAVGIIAVTLFAADKWFDLDPNFRFASMLFLCESSVVALCGYLTSYVVLQEEQDIVRLGEFAMDFSESAVKATFSAISDITRTGRANVLARRYKRTFLTWATLLAGIATGVIVAGRAVGAASGH